MRSGPLPLGPNSMRNRASAPNSVSGRSWRPVSFRFHFLLNSGNPKNVPGPIRAGSDYSLTYSTRKTSTDPSGFRSTTGGPRPGKCSLAYLRSRLQDGGFISTRMCMDPAQIVAPDLVFHPRSRQRCCNKCCWTYSASSAQRRNGLF